VHANYWSSNALTQANEYTNGNAIQYTTGRSEAVNLAYGFSNCYETNSTVTSSATTDASAYFSSSGTNTTGTTELSNTSILGFGAVGAAAVQEGAGGLTGIGVSDEH
jgi:hypothetical protein